MADYLQICFWQSIFMYFSLIKMCVGKRLMKEQDGVLATT